MQSGIYRAGSTRPDLPGLEVEVMQFLWSDAQKMVLDEFKEQVCTSVFLGDASSIAKTAGQIEPDSVHYKNLKSRPINKRRARRVMQNIGTTSWLTAFPEFFDMVENSKWVHARVHN